MLCSGLEGNKGRIHQKCLSPFGGKKPYTVYPRMDMNKYIPHVVNEDSDIETNFESLLLPDDLVETKTLHIHTHTHTHARTPGMVGRTVLNLPGIPFHLLRSCSLQSLDECVLLPRHTSPLQRSPSCHRLLHLFRVPCGCRPWAPGDPWAACSLTGHSVDLGEGVCFPLFVPSIMPL